MERSPEHFRNLVENTTAIHWELDLLTGRYGYVSPQTKTVLGYTEDEWIDYDFWMSIIHVEDRIRIRDFRRERISRNEDHECVYRLTHKDGHILRILDISTVISENSHPVKMMGLLIDITPGRACAMEVIGAAPKRQEELETIFNLSMDLLCKASMTHFLKVSPSAERILGYPEEELLQIPFIDLIHPDDAEKTSCYIEEKLKQGISAISFLNRYRHKDGSYRWLEWNTIPVVELGLLYGVARDITERKKTEEALARAEEEWNYAMDFFEDAIYIIDLNDRVVRANRTFYNLTGLTPEATIGRDIISIIHPYGEQIPCPVCQARKERRDTLIVMEADYPDNPTQRPIEVMVKTIRNSIGEAVGVLTGIHDLSRYRKTEEQIKKSLREKEILLREVHHRVKNNMTIVSSLIQMQSNYVKEEKYRQMFNESQDRIRSLALMHEKLCQSADLTKIDIRQYVGTLVGSLKRNYDLDVPVALEVDIEDLDLDIDRLIPCGLIINEVITNSFKYAFGSVKKPVIHLKMKEDAPDSISLEIADNGRGLPEGFKPEMSGGLGFRLILALAKQLQANLRIESDGGASIRLSFPKRVRYSDNHNSTDNH